MTKIRELRNLVSPVKGIKQPNLSLAQSHPMKLKKRSAEIFNAFTRKKQQMGGDKLGSISRMGSF